MKMCLMESSLLAALETPRMMKRKVKCKRKMGFGKHGSAFEVSEFVNENHNLILCNCDCEEIGNIQRSFFCIEICVKVINRM